MLSAFFKPKSVAVIGASEDPRKLGHAVLKNMLDCGYPQAGQLYPINRKAKYILGFQAYPSVLDVPDIIDLAVIVIPYQFVPDALRTCGEKGIPAVVIITAGFRESGVEGVERERELIEIAKEYGSGRYSTGQTRKPNIGFKGKAQRVVDGHKITSFINSMIQVSKKYKVH